MPRYFQSRRASSAISAALAVVLLLSSLPLAQAQVSLPALGDSVSSDLTVGDERRIGDQVMREIRLDPEYLDDPLLQEYVDGVFNPLVAAAKKLGNIGDDTRDLFAWQVFLVRDPTINAFALPGGFIGLHLGLIEMTTSRDELASVLGHELSHITQRHLARRMVGDAHSSLLATAAMILGVIAAAKAGNADMAAAAVIGSQAGAVQAQLSFSRDMEREADRVGYQVMVAAGYAPSGMYSMFQRMQQADHLNDDDSYPYLRDHPLTGERIADARARMGTTGPFAMPRILPEHMLMAARARVLADPRAEIWTQLENLDKGGRTVAGNPYEQLVARYTSTLAAIHMRDYDRAQNALQAAYLEMARLDAKGGDDATPAENARALRVLNYAALELALARNRPGAGEAVLQLIEAAGEPAESRPLVLGRAQLALIEHDPDSARRAADGLQTYLLAMPNDALAWSQLALLWQQLDQPLRAVRAQGESRAALGDMNGAIDRLRSGLRQSRGRDVDQIEAAVIDARLRSLLYQRRQLVALLYPHGGAPPNGELPP